MGSSHLHLQMVINCLQMDGHHLLMSEKQEVMTVRDIVTDIHRTERRWHAALDSNDQLHINFNVDWVFVMSVI